ASPPERRDLHVRRNGSYRVSARVEHRYVRSRRPWRITLRRGVRVSHAGSAHAIPRRGRGPPKPCRRRSPARTVRTCDMVTYTPRGAINLFGARLPVTPIGDAENLVTFRTGPYFRGACRIGLFETFGPRRNVSFTVRTRRHAFS